MDRPPAPAGPRSGGDRRAERPSAHLKNMPSVLDTEEFSQVARVDPDTIRDMTKVGAINRLLYTRKFLFDQREVSRFLRESSDPAWWEPYGEALAKLRAKRKQPKGSDPENLREDTAAPTA